MSPLTDKFTSTETASVQVLTSALPEVFEEAFKDLKEAPLRQATIDFWGVPIDPINAANSGDARVSVILVHFLRAR